MANLGDFAHFHNILLEALEIPRDEHNVITSHSLTRLTHRLIQPGHSSAHSTTSDQSCLQGKPVPSPSCYLENQMQGLCLPFFPQALHRGTMEKFRLFLEPTELAGSWDQCYVSFRVLGSSILLQALGYLNGSDEREGGS